MDNLFKIKITDGQTGKSDTLTLDLRHPIEEQIGTFGKSAKSHLHLIASTERDYGATTLHEIVRAVMAVLRRQSRLGAIFNIRKNRHSSVPHV